MATAAPAVASSTAANLDIASLTGARSLISFATYTLAVTNNATASYTGTISVSVIVNATSGDASAPELNPLATGTTNDGWTLGTPTETSTGFTVIASRAAGTLAAGASTPNLQIRFTSANGLTQTGGSGTAQVTAPSSTNNNTAMGTYPAS